MIKLIAADLDGTLLNSAHALPDGFTELVERLYDMGITFAAASGRQYYGAEKLFMPLRDKMMFIAENGGAVYEKEKLIYSAPMPDEDVSEMVREAQKYYDRGVRVLLSGEKNVYIGDSGKEFIESCQTYCARLKVISDFDKIPENDRIIKLALFDPNAETLIYPAMKKFSEKYNVMLSNTFWVDIVKNGINKGSAVSRLMERLGAGYDEAMVFGDYLNDYEMMSCCKYSFAMENAHPRLKAAAHYIAPSNDDNGVVREIIAHIPDLNFRIADRKD